MMSQESERQQQHLPLSVTAKAESYLFNKDQFDGPQVASVDGGVVATAASTSSGQFVHCQSVNSRVINVPDKPFHQHHHQAHHQTDTKSIPNAAEQDKQAVDTIYARLSQAVNDRHASDDESEQVITSLQLNSKKEPQPPTGHLHNQLICPTTIPSYLKTLPTSKQITDSQLPPASMSAQVEDGADKKELQRRLQRQINNQKRVVDPSGSIYYHWTMVVSFAFLYNFWSLSYRFAFREIDFDTVALWFALDYSADLIYILDVLINSRTGYLEDGVLQRNTVKIAQHYREGTLFYLDCFCLLPLDILYLSIGFNSILRCTRLVKIYKFWSYVDRTERHTNYPNVFRTVTLVHYILVIFHWNACLFHMISKNKIIDIQDLYKINDNRCHDILCQYLHAFYWSTLALTTIGDLPRPRTKGEYVYVTVELFFGLFLFASVLGHVANIVTNVSSARKEFQAKLDAVKTFMRMRHVSDDLQNKVIRWFDYLWVSQKASDEEKSVACLPDRLKAEIAIHVHLDTLKRVDIFQNTEAGFLCELVLRLKPVLFSPGDYVCRKNEVGHEMYIVSRGILEVVTDEGRTVVATLKAGSYFGEISVLNVGLAGNKRTASVRSVGYSDLFCLNKQDLWDVLKNYPNAEARIRARAEERLNKLDINRESGKARSKLMAVENQELNPECYNQASIRSKIPIRRPTGRSCSLRCRDQNCSTHQQLFCKRNHQMALLQCSRQSATCDLKHKSTNMNCYNQTTAATFRRAHSNKCRAVTNSNHYTCCQDRARQPNPSLFNCSQSLDQHHMSQSANFTRNTNFKSHCYEDSSQDSSSEERRPQNKQPGEVEEDWRFSTDYQNDDRFTRLESGGVALKKHIDESIVSAPNRCRSQPSRFNRAESADGATSGRGREITTTTTTTTSTPGNNNQISHIGPAYSSNIIGRHQRVTGTDYRELQNSQHLEPHHSSYVSGKVSTHSRLSSGSLDSSCYSYNNNNNNNNTTTTTNNNSNCNYNASSTSRRAQPISASRGSRLHQHHCNGSENGERNSSLILFHAAQSQASSRRSSRRRRQRECYTYCDETSDAERAQKQFQNEKHSSCNSKCRRGLSPNGAFHTTKPMGQQSPSGYWLATSAPTSNQTTTTTPASIIQLPILATPTLDVSGFQMLPAIQLAQSAQLLSLSHLNVHQQQASQAQAQAQAQARSFSPISIPISPAAQTFDFNSPRLQPELLFVCNEPELSKSAQSIQVDARQQQQHQQQQQQQIRAPSTSVQVKEPASLWYTNTSGGIATFEASENPSPSRASSVSRVVSQHSQPLESANIDDSHKQQQQHHESPPPSFGAKQIDDDTKKE